MNWFGTRGKLCCARKMVAVVGEKGGQAKGKGEGRSRRGVLSKESGGNRKTRSAPTKIGIFPDRSRGSSAIAAREASRGNDKPQTTH